ncbi:MAG TPA: hypothetical protein PLX15_04485, partial [Candidatus Woesearchaeota archaeon]|nr:hypothetical protein [Candidatus Woesearchaeota archaeon]
MAKGVKRLLYFFIAVFIFTITSVGSGFSYCESNADCGDSCDSDDLIFYSQGTCSLSTNECIYSKVEPVECCNDADCDDGNPISTEFCTCNYDPFDSYPDWKCNRDCSQPKYACCKTAINSFCFSPVQCCDSESDCNQLTGECNANYVECGGEEPFGTGVIKGDTSYHTSYPPTNPNWNYIASGTPGTCQWTCQAGYTQSGNTCVLDQIFCTGDIPSGSGVLLGLETYSSTTEPLINYWNYIASGTPGTCQWTCNSGFIRAGNTCIWPQCTEGSCCNTTTGEFMPNGYLCRASAGVCDVAEYCTGNSKDCPTNSFKPNNEICGYGSWRCSGNKDAYAPNSCQRNRSVTYCSGSGASCNGRRATQVENASNGFVCDNGNFVRGDSTKYAFSSPFNSCLNDLYTDGYGGARVKDVYACNGGNGPASTSCGHVTEYCNSGQGCCYFNSSSNLAYCDDFGSQLYDYRNFGSADGTALDFCTNNPKRQIKDCKNDSGCRNRDQAFSDTRHSQASYFCTNEHDCKRSCYAQPCSAGQYNCTDTFWNGTNKTYYCVNSTRIILQSNFVFNPKGNVPNEIYCYEDEYNLNGLCSKKQSNYPTLCFLAENCGKTGIASLFDKSEKCGNTGLAYCNFSSGEIVLLNRNYVEI